jgi:hypothetical protein
MIIIVKTRWFEMPDEYETKDGYQGAVAQFVRTTRTLQLGAKRTVFLGRRYPGLVDVETGRNGCPIMVYPSGDCGLKEVHLDDETIGQMRDRNGDFVLLTEGDIRYAEKSLRS